MLPIERETLKYLKAKNNDRRTSEIRDGVLKHLPPPISKTTDYLRKRLRRLEALGLVTQVQSRGRNGDGYAWRITAEGVVAIG